MTKIILKTCLWIRKFQKHRNTVRKNMRIMKIINLKYLAFEQTALDMTFCIWETRLVY